MNINDDLFDDKIRQKLKNEINYIPEDINIKIDDAAMKIEKRRFNVKNICSICACFIGITLLLGMAMPTYASNIPIIGSIFQIFNKKTYENYDKYASDLNITKESNGLKMTINKVVYDGIELSVFYTVESKEKMKDTPRFPGAELKINGKITTFGAGGTGKLSDDGKTFIGSIEYNTSDKKYIPKEIQEESLLGGYVEVPDEFIFSLNIDEIGLSNPIKGKWNFNIPVSSEKINGKVNEKECDIDLNNIANEYHINKIITTPLNTAIQGTVMNEKGDSNSNDLSFTAFDDKGRYIEYKSGGASSGLPDEDDNYISYFSNEFKEVYDDTESLTFIPYKHKFNESDNTKKEITEKLNLKGETKLYSDDGKEYATIAKIKTENGKTKIYYKSKYGVHVAPIEITNNKTNEKILSVDNSDDWNYRKQEEDIIYISNSDEYVITCDNEIKQGDYSIKTIDKSKSIEVYNDDKFTIKIK